MEQSSRSPKTSTVVLACSAIVVMLVAAIVVQTLQLRGLSSRVTKLEMQLAAKETQPAADPNNGGWNTEVTSGTGAFRVTLPDGWGPIYTDTDGDFMIVPGRTQPDLAIGSEVEVTKVQGYGTDSPALFSIWITKKGEAAPPRGTVEEFDFSNAKEPIKGTKYVYEYPADALAGIGYLRLAGDRDYEYVVPIGEDELHIYYSVYGSDPRNLIETVDEIVQRIVLGKAEPAGL